MVVQNDAKGFGFGERLREERKRLGLTQEDFAQILGVQRLSQSQYESENREPRLSYLHKASLAGVNVHYLLFGQKGAIGTLKPAEWRKIEQRAFELVDEYVSIQCNGSLSVEARFVLFDSIRAHLSQLSLIGSSLDVNISSPFPFSSG